MAELRTAKVVSSEPLSETERAAFVSALKKRAGSDAEVVFEIDRSLIFGFFIYFEGYHLDKSAKKIISDMKEKLIDAQLASP